MSQDDLKVRQIATRKNNADNAGGNSGSGTASGSSESRLPVRLDVAAGSSDSLAGWLEAYFAVEVTTAQSSRAVQRRDLTRFITFMQAEEGSDERSLWTSRLSRAFLDVNEIDPQGQQRFSDRTIARIAAHLKTFAKWIHSLRPLGRPHGEIKDRPHRPGPGDRAGADREPAPQAPRRRRSSPHPRREIKRSPPLQ